MPGGQWGNGAMGNAVWKGARLRDILDKAGLEADAVQVPSTALDEGPLPEVPDFVKALDLDLARHPDVLVAYRMNGEALPLLNGFPLRLVVPGYYATYWVKMLDDIEVIPKVDDNFWMSKAYRIPADPCGCMTPGQQGVATVPINRMTVRSFVTSLADGATVPAGQPATGPGASPSTAAPASSGSCSRPTAACAGPRRSSARTMAPTASANGRPASRPRPAAAMRSRAWR